MATVATPPQRADEPRSPRRRRRSWIPNALISVMVLVMCGGIAVWVGLAAITRDLPSVSVLDDPNSLGFKTALIYDRKGQLLWEINDPSGGKRSVVKPQDVSKAARR